MGERDELAQVMHDTYERARTPEGWLSIADAVLASDWLAAHVARATADAEARLAAVRELLDEWDRLARDNRAAAVRDADLERNWIASDYEVKGEALRAALAAPTTDADGRDERRDGVGGLAEAGRRLASEREDLIASGVDPADLEVPLRPDERTRWDQS